MTDRSEFPRFDDLLDHLQFFERERAVREFRANPPAWTRPPFTVPRAAQEPDMTPKDRHDELVALLTEIRDRLPERTEVKVAPFDPDLIETPGMGSITRNLAAIKHELETPMSEHGECCEPAPAAPREGEDRDEALAKVLNDADTNSHFSWEGTGEITREDYRRMARAAREHIEAERAAKGERR